MRSTFLGACNEKSIFCQSYSFRQQFKFQNVYKHTVKFCDGLLCIINPRLNPFQTERASYLGLIQNQTKEPFTLRGDPWDQVLCVVLLCHSELAWELMGWCIGMGMGTLNTLVGVRWGAANRSTENLRTKSIQLVRFHIKILMHIHTEVGRSAR